MEEPDDPSISLLWFGFYAFFSSVIVIFYSVQQLFEDLSLKEYLTELYHGAVILGICALICVCFYWLKKGVDRLLGAYQIENLDKFKIECVICFGGMALGGIVPRILVLFEPPGLYMKYYGFVIYPFSSICLIFLFLEDLGVRYKLCHENHKKLMATLACLHALSGFYTLQLNSFIYIDPQTQELASIVQAAFFTFAMVSSTELMLVLAGGVRDVLKPNVPVQKKIRKVAPVAQPVENDPRIECKICLLEYNDNRRIPRILKECGHTVCQECAQNFLRKFNNIHLFCPFCQQMSVVKGPATVLAKNFLVTDFMRMLKNDNN